MIIIANFLHLVNYFNFRRALLSTFLLRVLLFFTFFYVIIVYTDLNYIYGGCNLYYENFCYTRQYAERQYIRFHAGNPKTVKKIYRRADCGNQRSRFKPAVLRFVSYLFYQSKLRYNRTNRSFPGGFTEMSFPIFIS